MKKLFLACLAVITVTGCGNERDDPKPPPIDADFVSGAVKAPGGTVAYLEEIPALQHIVDFLIPPAYADLVGILPVSGATVELVRIDNSGIQVGDVIATATTTSAGTFTLLFPSDQSIAKTGDLIVRVSGGGEEMRGQVIESRADINPYSEYLLQRFISEGFDLATIDSFDIDHVLSFIEGYQLPVGADLATTISDLDAALSNLVEKQFEIINSDAGDSTALAGGYRATDLRFALQDDDGLDLVSNGELNYTNWTNNWILTDQLDGFLVVSTIFQSTTAARLQTNTALENTLYFSDIAGATSGSTGVFLSDANILYSETNLSQSVNDDLIRKTQPGVQQFQKALNNDILVALTSIDSVNFRYLDDDDEIIDPNIRAGDQSSRGILLASKNPTDATAADITGSFGRVGMNVFIDTTGRVEIETERNILAFDGIDSYNALAGELQHLERDGAGTSSYSTTVLAANSDISYAVASDGFVNIDGEEEPSAYVNDSFDLFITAANTSTDDTDTDDTIFTDADIKKSFAVKLPSTAVTLTDKIYRIIYTGMTLSGDSISVDHSLLDTFLTVTSETTGVLNGDLGKITQATRVDELAITSSNLAAAPVSITQAGDGSSFTLTYADGNGDLQFDGFINQDGSFAVMETSYTPTGSDPSSLGLAILVEVNP